MKTRVEDKTGQSEPRKAAVARIVQTQDRKFPYKVVFTDPNGEVTEHPFATVQECEAFIRAHTPVPTEPSKLFDRKAGEA